MDAEAEKWTELKEAVQTVLDKKQESEAKEAKEAEEIKLFKAVQEASHLLATIISEANRMQIDEISKSAAKAISSLRGATYHVSWEMWRRMKRQNKRRSTNE